MTRALWPTLALLLLPSLAPAALPEAKPAEVGMDPAKLDAIDEAVRAALEAKAAPGAVVLVARHGKVVFRRAYGFRAIQPVREAMTADTVFDLASLTKPVATASAIMLLAEQGKLRLSDPVSRHLPEFGRHGKEVITVSHLLHHTSGLIADNPLADYKEGKKKAWEKICELRLNAPPGERFVYSDVGFIVLGQLVQKLSGQPLDAFCRERLWEPLGLRDTGFLPAKDLRPRIAPTERVEGEWLRGVVHDPRARALGGVAGHAGLFGSADDLALFAQVLLDGGEHGEKRIFARESVRALTSPEPVPGGLRTCGWDARTRFSGNRGDSFDGFGHTGFTGTSLWADPGSDTVVVVLTSRLHPDGKGNVTRLRSRVASLAAASITAPPFPGKLHPVLCGIDVLKRDGFKALKGRKVGLVTNHTGRDREGHSTIDLLHGAAGVKLVALFSPEHGLRGVLDDPVSDGKDPKTGLPVFSLYGKSRRPSAAQMAGIDTLVYDIQDIGCRFYTYSTTLGYVLEAAAKHGLKVVVLDRPNPIGGLVVEGPVLVKGLESFVGYHPLPVRHGMTLGELALLFNKEREINADLEVVKVEGWRRCDTFDRTGLEWVHPSPNMRSLTAALLYPGVGLLETTNVSVGRGTDRPFELLGAPWINGRELAAALARRDLPGVRFVPTRFTPTVSTHKGKECGGVQVYVEDWSSFRALPVGLALACELRRLYPKEWQSKSYGRLLAHPPTLKLLEAGEAASVIEESWRADLEAFRKVRQGYLLY